VAISAPLRGADISKGTSREKRNFQWKLLTRVESRGNGRIQRLSALESNGDFWVDDGLTIKTASSAISLTHD
jgi:hypothetical protein